MSKAIAVDVNGNVFVTGNSWSGTADIVTIKYSSAGVPLWTNRLNGTQNANAASASAVVVDFNGDVIVAGTAWGGLSYDFTTIKYSKDGTLLWTKYYEGGASYGGLDKATALAVDGSGNATVTGYSQADSYGVNSDALTVSYASNGTFLWANRFWRDRAGGYVAQGNSVAAGTNGNVYVAAFGGAFYVQSLNRDYFTIKYSGSGSPLWTNRYDGPANLNDEPSALAVDGNGNVFVTGKSFGLDSTYDYATIAYDSAGAGLWTNRYSGLGNANDDASAIGVDWSGKVFVTGTSTGPGTADDFATLAYSSTGLPLWTNRYNGPANSDESASALAVDGKGNVYLTGRSVGTGTSNDFTTLKLGDSLGFEPAPGFSGLDIFNYVVRDSFGNYATGVVQVAVSGFAPLPPAPPGGIRRTSPGSLAISWGDIGNAPLQLFRSATLGPSAIWTPVTETVQIVNGHNEVNVALTGLAGYFQFQPVYSTNDVPDNTFVDANGDGVDGIASQAVFVSRNTGNDDWVGSRNAPMATLQAALSRAVARGKMQLFVARGEYVVSSLQLSNGISIYGGYDENTWQRTSGNRTILTSTASLGVRAMNLSSPTTLDLLEISVQPSIYQMHNYGLFAVNSPGLIVRNCSIQSGPAHAGFNGSSGSIGNSGNAGSSGGPGVENGGLGCAKTGQPLGGAGGSSPVAGGTGGRPNRQNVSGFSGSAGVGGAAGGPGTPAKQGNWNTPSTYWGSPGTNGSAGATGSAGTAAGFAFSSNGFNDEPIGNGGTGNTGGNGGGGGGGGGTAGGGSFAVYLWNSSITLENCQVASGAAGYGGAGANGGSGGNGGAGGTPDGTGRGNPYGGSSTQDDGSNGGRGGRGGNGGTGGQGGGGVGGPSIGIYRGSGSTANLINTSVTLGSGGNAGSPNGQSGWSLQVYP